MPRYVAFLRGVSPMNLRMADLRRCLEDSGFGRVVTVRSSGNVAFDTSLRTEDAVVEGLARAMDAHLAQGFFTLVRAQRALQELVAADPFEALVLPPLAKRLVSFLPEPPQPVPALPIEAAGASILAVRGRDVLSMYLPNPQGPEFMKLIEQAFGTDITTRTWDSVRKCAEA